MRPRFHDELKEARIADLHREAERDRLIRASAQARRARKEHGRHPASGAAGVFARRLLIILGARTMTAASQGTGARSLVIAAPSADAVEGR